MTPIIHKRNRHIQFKTKSEGRKISNAIKKKGGGGGSPSDGRVNEGKVRKHSINYTSQRRRRDVSIRGPRGWSRRLPSARSLDTKREQKRNDGWTNQGKGQSSGG